MVQSYALERRVLHGLACEWQAVIQELDPEYKHLMTPPLFRLTDTTSLLGSWSADKREICINRKLAFEYPWGDVREVLLHEMAHQLADRLVPSGTTPPHGYPFHRACHILGANPKASGKLRPLGERIGMESENRQSGFVKKIEKLMALSNSENSHEARAAMMKAHDLMRKHHIQQLESERPRNYASMLIGRPALRHPRNKYHLGALITEFYFVQGIWVSAYVMGKQKMGRALEISGARTNLQIAAYVYDYIENHIELCWKSYKRKNHIRGMRRTDLAMGIIQGFRSKLEAEKAARCKRTCENALIPANDPKLSEYLKRKYPHTVSISKPKLSVNEQAFNDGKQIGKKLVIAKGIAAQKGYRGKMIQAP